MSADPKSEDEPFDMLTSAIVMELAELGRADEALTSNEWMRRADLARDLDRRVPRTR